MSRPKARLTVTEAIYHQAEGEQPTSTEAAFSRLCSTDEQPFGPRRMLVTEAWRPLEHGWIEQAGMLSLRNDAGKFTDVVPTPEQRAAEVAKVIEVAQVRPHGAPDTEPPSPFAAVRPGESLRFEPLSLSSLVVRCRAGETRCTILLIPG